MDRGIGGERDGHRKRKGQGGVDFQAAAQILCDMPHTRDTRSLAIRYGGRGSVVRNRHARDGVSIRPLLPQAHMNLMRLRMLGGIGRGLADNLQKGCGDTRVLRQRPLNIDLHTHQAKSMDDITQLLCRLAGTATAQIGGN